MDTIRSDGDHPVEPPRRPATQAEERDFLYQRRLASVRAFVTDDGVAGLHLSFEGDDTLALRIERPLLDRLHQAIGRLKDSPRIER